MSPDPSPIAPPVPVPLPLPSFCHTPAVPAGRPPSMETVAVCTVRSVPDASQEGEHRQLGRCCRREAWWSRWGWEKCPLDLALCRPLLRVRLHAPCLAALNRSMCGDPGNPDSFLGLVPDSCSQTSLYCLRQMEPVTYRGGARRGCYGKPFTHQV